MDGWIREIAIWLADYYLLATLLLLVTAGLMRLVRQPAQRMALSRATVAGLACLAAITAVSAWPRISLPFASALSPSPDFSNSPTENSTDDDALTHHAAPELTAGPESAATTPIDPPEDLPAAGRTIEDDNNLANVGIAHRLTSILTRGFLLGTALAAIWLAVGVILTTRLRLAARHASEPIQSVLDRMVGDRPVSTRVMLSNRVNQAVAVGCFAPDIILPKRFSAAESRVALEAALAHECAHIRNGDLRLLALMRCLALILYAHPLYWMLRRRVQIDQELLADAAAGERCDVADYAEVLLYWFRTNAADRSRLTTATLGLWERPHSLKRRIAMLLDDGFRVKTDCPTVWSTVGSGLLIAVVFGLSFFTLRATPPSMADEVRASESESPTPLRAAVGNNALAEAPEVTEPSDHATALAAKPAETESSNTSETSAKKDSKYRSAEEAWRAGIRGDPAARRKAFEAALTLADDDAFKVRIYESLRPMYRRLAGENKMVEACEFIIGHTDSDAKRSLTRRDLVSFMYQRGKLDRLVSRHEDVLKKDPNDRTSLYILSEVYDRAKPDAKRAAELLQRMTALDGDKPLDVPTNAKLAMQLVRQKKYDEGAALYQKIAPLDEDLAAWHWKEAASAWLKNGVNDKALAAAKKAVAAEPETRSKLLTHFWHRHLGEVFLATGEFKLAATHLEQAIENTDIDGYLRDCRGLLAEARRKADDGN
jgi:beta-lactamase regulating signal transducer with metallopeptidase domain